MATEVVAVCLLLVVITSTIVTGCRASVTSPGIVKRGSDGLSSSENIVRDKTDFGTINANIDIPAITQLSAEGSHITLETINEIEMAVLGMKLVQEYHRKCSIMITTDGTNKRLFNELITQLTQAHQPYILLNSDHNTLDVASVQYGKRAGRSGCEVYLLAISAVRMEVENIKALLQKYSNTMSARLIFMTTEDMLDHKIISEYLKNQAFSRQYQMVLLNQRKSNGKVRLYRRCLFCQFQARAPGLPPAEGDEGRGVVLSDTWIPRTGFTKHANIFPDQYSDLNGYVLRSTLLAFQPFAAYRIQGDRLPLISEDCLDARLLREVVKKLNCSSVLREPKDGIWGFRDSNNSWNGILAAVQSNETDTSQILSISALRMEDFDMTVAYYVEPMTFMMKMPGALPQWQAIYKPFTYGVWVLVMVTAVAAGPVLWLLVTAAAYVNGRESKNWYTDTGIVSLSYLALYTFCSILQEPSRLQPNILANRLFLASWWLFTLLLSTMYSTSLIAHLSFPGSTPTINTLNELSRSSMTWGMLDSYGAGYQLFKESKIPAYKKLFSEMQYVPEKDMLSTVSTGGYGFISWKTYMRYMVAKKKADPSWRTDIHIARELFFPSGFGWALKKGSQIRPTVDKIFRRLNEAGIVEMWLTDLIDTSTKSTPTTAQKGQQTATNQKADDENIGGPKALTMYHVQGLFMVVGFGLLTSLIVFIAEALLAKKGRKKT